MANLSYITAMVIWQNAMNTLRLLLLLIAVACLTGCNSTKPLILRHYSKNIIVKKDRTIFLEQEQIDFKNMKQELVKRLIGTTTPITIHFSKDIPQSTADKLVNRLRQDGFKDLEIVVFRD